MNINEFQNFNPVKIFILRRSIEVGRQDDLGKALNFNEISNSLTSIRDKILYCTDYVIKTGAITVFTKWVANVANEFVANTNDLYTFQAENRERFNNIKGSVQNYIEKVLNMRDESKALQCYAAVISESFKTSADSSVSKQEWSELKKQYEDKMREMFDLSEALKKSKTGEAILGQENIYQELAESSRKRAFKWLVATIVSFGSLAIISCLIFCSTNDSFLDLSSKLKDAYSPEKYYIPLLIKLFKNLLVLSLPIIGLKICLKKYNSERHLQIVYHNRIDVLKLHNYFNAVLSGDSRNHFILELTKFICSDPQTGYLDKSREIIHPTIQLPEKITGI